MGTVRQLWEQSQYIFPFCASHVSVVSSARIPASTRACVLVYCWFFWTNVMWFKDKCSRIMNSFVVSRQCQSMILPGSHLFLLLIYLRKLESPWALVSLLGNIRLSYFSWGICKVWLIHVFKVLGDMYWNEGVNYRLAMQALKIETKWIKPSPLQGNTVLDRRETLMLQSLAKGQQSSEEGL